MKKYYKIAKKDLFNLCRSLTGQGVRKTLSIIKKEFKNLKIKKIRSGTKVYDWKIPPEWNVKDAFVLDKNKDKIIDFKKNNLHLLGYSIPKKIFLKKNDLLRNLFFIKNQPSAIPYVTSYYKKQWGFCISYNQKKKIDKYYNKNDFFYVNINTSFKKNGSLNYGEYVLKGSSKQEVLISTYICHPSMANNELSGIVVSMALIDYFKKRKLNKSIRFIFVPETIGSIAYVNKNISHLKNNVVGGFNLSCIGDEKMHSCMFSKYGNFPSDEAIIKAYKKLNIKKYRIFSFLKRGSDERQYNSPGVDLPISSIFRSKYGEYPEYHTSLDNFKLVTLKGLYGGFRVAKTSIEILQQMIIPKSRILCEPFMSKRNMYPTTSFKNNSKETDKVMDFLQYADGTNTLEQISNKIKISVTHCKTIYKRLKKENLIY